MAQRVIGNNTLIRWSTHGTLPQSLCVHQFLTCKISVQPATPNGMISGDTWYCSICTSDSLGAGTAVHKQIVVVANWWLKCTLHERWMTSVFQLLSGFVVEHHFHWELNICPQVTPTIQPLLLDDCRRISPRGHQWRHSIDPVTTVW